MLVLSTEHYLERRLKLENKVIIRGRVIYNRIEAPPYLIRVRTEKGKYIDSPCVEFESPCDVRVGDFVSIKGELSKGYNYRDNKVVGSYMFIRGLEYKTLEKIWDPIEEKYLEPVSDNNFNVTGILRATHPETDVLTLIRLDVHGIVIEISAFLDMSERARKLKKGDTVFVNGKIQTVRKARKRDGVLTTFEMPVAAYIKTIE